MSLPVRHFQRAEGLAWKVAPPPPALPLSCSTVQVSPKTRGLFIQNFPQGFGPTYSGGGYVAHNQAGTHRNKVLTGGKGLRTLQGQR